MSLPTPSAAAVAALAPTGTLRAAINISNFLLVTGRGADGNPEGVSPDMAKTLAGQLGVGIELLRYKTPVAAGRRRRHRGMGHRQRRGRAGPGPHHRLHRRLLRDRGHLSGAAGFPHHLGGGGRPARQPHRQRRRQRLRPVARPQHHPGRGGPSRRARRFVEPVRRAEARRPGRACGPASSPTWRSSPAPASSTAGSPPCSRPWAPPGTATRPASTTWWRSWRRPRPAAWWPS